MGTLESWLRRATRHLSRDSANQVRSEIQAHYDSGREVAMSGGATGEDAGRLALAALGDASEANRQYRQVLLTTAEARMLRDGNREASMVCSRQWLKPAAAVLMALAVTAVGVLLAIHKSEAARIVLTAVLAMSPLVAPLVLPVYTKSRARIYRIAKWAAVVGTFVLALGADAFKWSWMLAWPLIWVEWTRASIRRKLPVERWPKQLYL